MAKSKGARQAPPPPTLQATAIAHAQRAYIEAAHQRALQIPHVRKNHARNAMLASVLAGVPIQPNTPRAWRHRHMIAMHSERAARFISEVR